MNLNDSSTLPKFLYCGIMCHFRSKSSASTIEPVNNELWELFETLSIIVRRIIIKTGRTFLYVSRIKPIGTRIYKCKDIINPDFVAELFTGHRVIILYVAIWPQIIFIIFQGPYRPKWLVSMFDVLISYMTFGWLNIVNPGYCFLTCFCRMNQLNVFSITLMNCHPDFLPLTRCLTYTTVWATYRYTKCVTFVRDITLCYSIIHNEEWSKISAVVCVDRGLFRRCQIMLTRSCHGIGSQVLRDPFYQHGLNSLRT